MCQVAIVDSGEHDPHIPSDTLVRAVLLGGLGALLLAVLLIDVLDVGGLRSLVGRNSGLSLWHHFFKEGSIAEWLQALGLITAIFFAAVGVTRADGGGDRDTARMLRFLALGFGLMVIEDSGNVSQTIGAWADAIAGVPHALVRMPIFGLIALVMIYGPLRHRQRLRREPRAMIALVVGYGFYALMVGGEILNQLFPFYVRGGGWVRDTLLGGRLLTVRMPPGPGEPLGLTGSDVMSFFLMDYVYEETLEVIGVSFLLVGVLRLTRGYKAVADRRHPPVADRYA